MQSVREGVTRADGGKGLERKHGFSAEPVPASADVGSSKNLKDLKGSQPAAAAPAGVASARSEEVRRAIRRSSASVRA